MNLIAKLGMGYHNGPFSVTTNGATPNWKGLTWPGPAGETLVAEAIEVSMYPPNPSPVVPPTVRWIRRGKR